MKVLSLFDGISCGMVAMERAGFEVDRYVAYEIDKFAVKVSEKNYPEIERHGDVFRGDYTQYRGFDILIGGSPCTHWSVARTDRETTSDGVGFQLFLQFVRALIEAKPRFFLYENNYGMSKGIEEEITKYLGVEPIMINSSMVSAQNRKRLYWTNLPGIGQPEDKGILLKDIVHEIDETVFDGYYNRKEKMGEVGECIQVGSAIEINGHDILKRVYSVHGKSPTLNTMQGGNREPKIAIDRMKWRKLSVLEMERLQTLPDGYTEGVSNTQRKKGIGNGWTVDVIVHLLKGLDQV